MSLRGQFKRLWTPAERAKLTELWNAGVSDAAIARRLDRTVGACRSQVNNMGLIPRDKRTAIGIIRRNAARGKA